MHLRPVSCSLLAGFLALTGQAASAEITRTFNTGLEGWSGAGGVVSHVAAGGNSGGFLRQVDNAGTFMTFSAPGAFLGRSAVA